MTDGYALRAHAELAAAEPRAGVSRIAAKSSEEAVKTAVDMVDLVGGGRSLRQGPGVSYKGRCPFHDERTPSFSVDPVKKTLPLLRLPARGGDATKFVQETENLDFVQGGRVAGGPLRRGPGARGELPPRRESRRAERKRLEALLEDSAGVLFPLPVGGGSEAEPARAYLGRARPERARRRADFRLGFAPLRRGTCVCAAARSKGFTPAELERAGLSSRGRRGPVDRFRGAADVSAGRRPRPRARLRCPADAGRRPAQVPQLTRGARSSRKSDYRLCPRSRPHLRSPLESRAVVVEGYTDVLALHQAGVVETVASMGTALTEQQVRELARLVGSGTLLSGLRCRRRRPGGRRYAGWQPAQATGDGGTGGAAARRVATPPTWSIADPEGVHGGARRRRSGCSPFGSTEFSTAPGSRDQRYRQVAACPSRAPRSRSSERSRCSSSSTA